MLLTWNCIDLRYRLCGALFLCGCFVFVLGGAQLPSLKYLCPFMYVTLRFVNTPVSSGLSLVSWRGIAVPARRLSPEAGGYIGTHQVQAPPAALREHCWVRSELEARPRGGGIPRCPRLWKPAATQEEPENDGERRDVAPLAFQLAPHSSARTREGTSEGAPGPRPWQVLLLGEATTAPRPAVSTALSWCRSFARPARPFPGRIAAVEPRILALALNSVALGSYLTSEKSTFIHRVNETKDAVSIFVGFRFLFSVLPSLFCGFCCHFRSCVFPWFCLSNFSESFFFSSPHRPHPHPPPGHSTPVFIIVASKFIQDLFPLPRLWALQSKS